MCGEQDPANVAEALAMLDRALAALTTADAGSLPTAVQAQALRALERAEARHTAARARFLAAFTAQDGYEDDGQGSARMWLRWQTRVTRAAAAGAVGWVRRLAAHPVIAAALAEGRAVGVVGAGGLRVERPAARGPARRCGPDPGWGGGRWGGAGRPGRAGAAHV